MTDNEKEIVELRRELNRKHNPFSGISLNTIMQTLIIAGVIFIIAKFSDFSDFMLLQQRHNETVNAALARQDSDSERTVTTEDLTEKLIPLTNQINANTGELNTRTAFMDKTNTNYQELRLENTVMKNRIDNLETTVRSSIRGIPRSSSGGSK